MLQREAVHRKRQTGFVQHKLHYVSGPAQRHRQIDKIKENSVGQIPQQDIRKRNLADKSNNGAYQ